MHLRYLLVLIFAISLASIAASAQAVLHRGATVLISRHEPQPLQRAAADLVSDLHKVLGGKIRLVHSPAQAAPVTIWICLRRDVPHALPASHGWERLRLAELPHPWPGSPAHQAIVLSGSDTLGAIYAVYQFSRQFLHVDPMYWWTDHAPARRATVTVPAGYDETQAPVFRYRGFFINDEDLLTGWRPGTAQGADISLRVWNRIFETILRLKGNMVIPGTWIFPYERQIRLAVRRGLMVSQHHVNVLGLDTYRWPKKVPYLFTSNRRKLEDAWATAVSEYPRRMHAIWSVGYRGLNDYPFWLVDPNAPKTMAGRAAIIQQAIAAELRIIRRVHPHAPVILNTWQETGRFLLQGLLHKPKGVTLVWADDGHGIIQDHGHLSRGEGVYYHTMMIDGASNHLSELVPPATIQEELTRAVRAGATDYLVVNTSNTRPAPMTSEETMSIAWNPHPWLRHPHQSQYYVRRWDAREFGRRAAPAVARYEQAYFAAPAHYGPQPDQRMGDNFYYSSSRMLLVAMAQGRLQKPFPTFHGRPRFFSNWTALATHIEHHCQAALPRWQTAARRARAARSLVAPSRRQFYQANVFTQVTLNQQSNLMLLDITRAVLTRQPGQRLRWLQAALLAGNRARQALHAADYGKWKGFYTRGDWLVDVPLTLRLIHTVMGQLQGHRLNLNTLARAKDVGFAYHMITAYQGRQRTRFHPFTLTSSH